MNAYTIVEEKDKNEKKKKKKNKSNKNANPPPKNEEKKHRSIKNETPNKNKDKDKDKDKNKNDITNITNNNYSYIEANNQKGSGDNEKIPYEDYYTERDDIINANIQKPDKSQGLKINEYIKNYENMMEYLMKKINRVEFEDAKDIDNRSFLNTICSYELNNGIIANLFYCNKNDILTIISLILLTLALYIFINVMIMKSNAELNLYTQKNKEKILGGAISLNMFCPLLVYLIVYIIKKKITVNEFFVNQYYQLYRVLYFLEKKKINVVQKDLGLHNIETKISLRKNKAEFRLLFYFAVGTPFLLFNFLLVSSYCGIYENSVDCVIWNTIVSIIFSFIFSRALLLVSATLRYYSLKNKDLQNEKLYIISCFLNLYYLSYCGRKLCSNLYKICCKKKDEKNSNNNEDNIKENKEEDKEEDKEEYKEENKEENNIKEGMIETSNL